LHFTGFSIYSPVSAFLWKNEFDQDGSYLVPYQLSCTISTIANYNVTLDVYLQCMNCFVTPDKRFLSIFITAGPKLTAGETAKTK